MSHQNLTGYPSIDKPWLALYRKEELEEEIPAMTIYQYLYECNKFNMDNVLLDFMGKSICTKEVFTKADRVAEILVHKYGIKQGDIVSICMPMLPETFYLFLAINKIGAIANMVDPRINEARINTCIGKESKLVFAVDVYIQKICDATKEFGIDVVQVSAAESLGILKRYLYKRKTNIKKPENTVLWKEFLQTEKENISIEQVVYSERMPAVIVHTSGTTGEPKACVLSNDGINYISYAQKKHVPDMEAGDKYLVIMPPFIAYGIVCGLCCPMLTCQKMILIPKFEPKDFAKLVHKYKPNHMLGVPSFFEDLIESKLLKSEDLSFIKYCIVGGDKLNIASEEKINKFFHAHNVKNRIVKGYGMTELGSAAFTNRDNEHNKVGSTGTPYIKNNVKIINPENGEMLTYEEVGEIYVSSPSVMLGYLNNERAQNEILVKDENGCFWIKTGDLGSVDRNGNLTISGRIKRMIVRPDGHNVFPSAIEEVICSYEAVKDCVVVGMQSREYENGKIPVAFVVLNDNVEQAENVIEEKLRELSLIKLPPRDIALEYRFITAVPMTPNGKVDYRKLEEMAEGNK